MSGGKHLKMVVEIEGKPFNAVGWGMAEAKWT